MTRSPLALAARREGAGPLRPRRQETAVVVALVLAVTSVSFSGPLIAVAAAPALAIAFWRNLMALPLLVPVAGMRRRDELRALFTSARRQGLYCVLAGVALAAHFATWVPSSKLTAVATATALVATQPVWQGLIALGQGRRLSGWMWAGIGLAVAGAAVATGADLHASGTALWGDLLALAGGLLAAVYLSLGEKARVTISTTTYTAVCYSVCAAVLLVVCLVARVPLSGYPASAWVALAALTIGPQLLGHSMFNFALRRVSATTVSVVALVEVPGTALIAAVWLRQLPRTAAWPGLLLLVGGVLLVILAARRPVRTPQPAEAVLAAEGAYNDR